MLVNNLTHKLHWTFDVLSGLWLLLLGFFIIQKYTKNHKSTENTETTAKLYTPVIITMLLIISVIHIFFGAYNLGKAAYIDERLWTYSNEKRIEKYWNNILEHDWRNTRPSDKPGVTLAILSGPSLLSVTPSDFKDDINDKNAFAHMLFTMRLPIIIFSTLALFFFYHVLGKLFNPTIGMLSTAFIGLSPILLGVSRIINPDALTWIFIPLTLYAYFTYQKTQNINWIYTTGILLGLGLLTKYIANLIFPFFFILLFTHTLFGKYTKDQLRTHLRNTLSGIGIITLIAIMTFYILYPGTWVKLDRIFIGTLWSQPFEPIWQYFVIFVALIVIDFFFNNSTVILWISLQLRKFKSIIIAIIPIIFLIVISFTLYHTYLAPQPINFEQILTSPKITANETDSATTLEAFATSFYALIFGISPIALLGILFTLIFITLNKWSIPNIQRSTIWNILLFILIFYFGSIFSSTIPTVRYQIILYPLILTVSAFGWYYLSKILFPRNKTIFFYVLFAIIIATSTYTFLTFKPFYFSYNSPILPNGQLINPKDMGDGNYEAAQFLNSLPNAKNLNVWSDKRGVCTFFIGDCVSVIRKSDFIKNGPHYDYFVISKGRETRTVNMSRGYSQGRIDYPVRLDLLYTENPESIFELNPGNISANYIKVIPKENVNVWRGN
ncbi:MAG: ArnT family glycosyltransferase [Candidatus Moraniibacteriota bacterium]